MKYTYTFETISDSWDRVLIYDIETVSDMEELERARSGETYEYLDVCTRARHICMAVKKDIIKSNQQIVTNKILKKYERTEYQDYYLYTRMNTTAEEMAEDLLKICVNYGLHLLSHNGLRFDFLIFKHLIEKGEVKLMEQKGNHFLRKGKHYIRLIDSFSLTNTSLQASCQKYGIQMQKLQTGTLKDYLMNDVCMLIELVRAFDRAGMKYTHTRTARAFYTEIATSYGIEKIRTYTPKGFSWEYAGGRCEVWKSYAEQVYQYDANSMYPYVMSSFSYPAFIERKNEYHIYVREATEREKEAFMKYIDAMRDVYLSYMIAGENITEMKKLLDLKKVYYYARVKIQSIHPAFSPYADIITKYFPFSYRWKDRRVYALKPDHIYSVEGYELSFLAFFDFELVSLHLTRAEKLPFSSHIREMYEARKKAKASGDHTTAERLKSVLVNLYGLFGLRHEYTSKKVFEKSEKDLLAQELSRFSYADTMWEKYGILQLHSENERATLIITENSYEMSTRRKDFSHHMSSPLLATATTSHARFWLLLNIYHITLNRGGHVFYCDTDSIFTDIALIDNDELGFFKHEGTYEKAYFFLPKTYALMNDHEWKVKAKGVGRHFLTERPTQSFRMNFSLMRKMAISSDRTVMKKLLSDFSLEHSDTEVDFFREYAPLLTKAIQDFDPVHAEELRQILKEGGVI